MQIPEKGTATDQLLAQMEQMRDGDADWRGGKVWSLVYFAGEAHHELLKEAHNLFIAENGLNPMAFQSLKRMESDVVRMTASMLNGGPEAVGTMTSGGTESILLAVKAARDRARKRRPWIRSPEMVLPETAHVAFEKAAHYFDVKIRYAPLRSDYRVDVKALKKLVGRNTVLIAASAPQYPHGVIDPIAEIGAFAQKKKLPFHVDACVGGFILPWLEALGHPLPTFDFRVPGVTSMSADLHKYGFAEKGASVVVYRSMDYLKHQFFVSTDWPGGIYAGPTIAGTRPGGNMAAAWAAMMSLGREGYLAHAAKALEATKKLASGLERIAPLGVLGTPDATIVTYASKDPEVSILAVADKLQELGWHVDRQQRPDSIHCTVTSNHLAVVDDYLRDVAAAVAHVKANPGLRTSGEAAMYGMMAKVPVRSMVKVAVGKVMEQMYGPAGAMPDLGGGSAVDGPLGKAMAKYGPAALGVLEKLEGVKGRLRLGRRR
jgi:sphinganine-1-phosphate aldolase